KDSLVRGMPNWTSYGPVTQINARTYVYHPENDERGVYFFSLRVNSLIAALGARNLFGLPFYNIDNSFNKVENKIEVSCSTEGSHIFSVQYEPKERLIQNDLASFLTERYCIWNVHRNRIIKIPIRHKHWNLTDVEVDLKVNKLFAFGDYSSDFIAHY